MNIVAPARAWFYISGVPTSEVRFHSRFVVTPEGVRDAVVTVSGGRILSVRDAEPGERAEFELGTRWLIPGLVDTHVHVNDPGRAEWEGFATATAAALAGGITTVVDMPLNSIPATVNAEAARAKIAALENIARCDVSLWGGVIPGNTDQLRALAALGVAGFKCFLAPSGVEEFPNVGAADLERAMPVIASLGLPLLAHAELPAELEAAHGALAAHNAAGMHDAAPARGAHSDPRHYATWLATRPDRAETAAIELVIRLCRATGCRVHVVHLSSWRSLAILEDARAQGVPITAETCPHYLTFDAESIPDGATEFKCAPPIRDAANRERMWDALERGSIDFVASDHSPCPPSLKCHEAGDFMRAWGGIASLEVAFAALWTGARGHGIAPERVVRWMSESPARLAGLAGIKGSIAAGADADLAVWNPEAEWTVDAACLHQRHPLTPYARMKVRGVVERVFLRGAKVFEHGSPVGAPAGRFVAPGTRSVAEAQDAAGKRPRGAQKAGGHAPRGGAMPVDAPRRIG